MTDLYQIARKAAQNAPGRTIPPEEDSCPYCGSRLVQARLPDGREFRYCLCRDSQTLDR